ncbi:MBL fold metallo-hydrolase [Saccharopolyspora gloriosae]|uniref:MBL fold metallo-hydrolase n=1 Tax=Saccharopolyspora gloriosae TaxID=455344 RepID=UPI001FB6FEEE|nr:MBL fold metallo-hydrolase [Saccharopolyspora gloriosae]
MTHPAYGELRSVTPFASVLLAANPGPMTLDGTNTWLIGTDTRRVVLDPGPDDGEHLERIVEHGPVSLILLSHHHFDHTEGAAELASRTGAPVRALDPRLCVDAEPFADGEVIDAAGVPLTVLATPGHTRDSVCFRAGHEDASAVFTADSILGRGTTVVAHPDGHLGSYLASLRALAALPAGIAALPGHGPELPDVAAAATGYLAHREQRLGQIREVVRGAGAQLTAREVVEIVYADVDPSVWPAAELSVEAQLTYLAESGER